MIELKTRIPPGGAVPSEQLRLPCREVFAHSQRPVEVDDGGTALADEARAVHAGFW